MPAYRIGVRGNVLPVRHSHGRTIASGGVDGTIKLWNFYSGKLIRTLDGHTDGVFSVVFSPDGDKLASADLSGTIKVWRMDSGEMAGTLKGHSTWVELAFNPQDKTLISGSFDDTIKVWRLSP